MVQREHRKALNTLLKEVIIFIHDVLEEDRRGLTAQLQSHRNDALCGVLIDHLADWSRAGKRNLLDALMRGQRRTSFIAEAIDDIENARWQHISDLFDHVQNRCWSLLSWLQHNAVTRGQGWGNLPRRHEDREVPRNNLPHHAKWLIEVIRHCIFINLRQATFLSAQNTSEVTEVVYRQWNICSEGLTHCLAIFPGFSNSNFL